MGRGTLEQDTVMSSHRLDTLWMSANPPATEISDERLRLVLRKFEDAKETRYLLFLIYATNRMY